MNAGRKVTFYHASQSRSGGTRILLEELGADYDLRVLNLKTGDTREPAPLATCPYGDFDTMLKTLTDQLEKGPYILGDKFTAADVLWGTALTWTVAFKLVPELPVIRAYIDRINARPAVAKARQTDEKLVA